MDAQVKAILEETVGYIEKTQSELDKHNEMRDAFLKRAHQVAGVLANRGLIAHDAIEAFVEKVASDESGNEVWKLVEVLASAVRPDEFGAVAKVASSGKITDPFERLVLFGDARAEARVSGMVD